MNGNSGPRAHQFWKQPKIVENDQPAFRHVRQCEIESVRSQRTTGPAGSETAIAVNHDNVPVRTGNPLEIRIGAIIIHIGVIQWMEFAPQIGESSKTGGPQNSTVPRCVALD